MSIRWADAQSTDAASQQPISHTDSLEAPAPTTSPDPSIITTAQNAASGDRVAADQKTQKPGGHTEVGDNASNYTGHTNVLSDDTQYPAEGEGEATRGAVYLGGRNFLARWLFLPVFTLLSYTRKHNLALDALGLPASESARNVARRMEKHMTREFGHDAGGKGSVRRALRRTFLSNYNLLVIWRLLAVAFTYLGAYYLLMNVISYIEKLVDDKSHGSYVNTHIYALALLLSIWLASISTHQLMAASTRVGIQVRSAIMVLIYRKSLRLHSVELAIGDIVNLLADDVNRLAEAYVHRHYLLSSVLEGLVVVALAFVELGLSAFPALALLLLLFPIQYKLGQYIAHNAFAMARRTADRVSAISEILTTLRVIKCYAWEIFFRDRVKAIRAEELRHLRRNLMAKGWTFVVAFVAPVLLTLLCLVMDQHIMGEMNMRATHIFTLLSIFNMIRIPLVMLPLAVRSHESAKVVHQRLDEFFAQPETTPPAHNADFIWEGDVNPTVAFLSMTVRAGDVVAVVGDVGAGKSSLLSAIMGQLRHSEGEMRVHGSIAFVPSEPWLVNATLKDNIVFGMPYNEHKYRAVVRACALTRDINSLTRGDETEIGERGANLTMGQRHRVSIARAAYSDAEILLLDDPLSTMDAQIGKRIFNECISGYLRKKAVVIVTNQLQFLEHCDQILIMSDGHCIEQGTYRELVAKDLNLATLIGESIEIEDPYLVDDLVEEIEHNQPIDERDDARRMSTASDSAQASGGGGGDDDSRSPLAQQPSTGPAITFAEVEHPARGTGGHMVPGESGDSYGRSGPGGGMRSYAAPGNQGLLSPIDVNATIHHGQLTIMGGTILGTIGHNNTLARALERSQLTIHSMHDLQNDDVDLSGRGGNTGSSWISYRLFARRTTGTSAFLAICLFFVFVQGLRIFSDFWLKHYADEVEAEVEDEHLTQFELSVNYLSIYGITAATYMVGAFFATQFFYWAMIQKSRSLHKKIFIRILRIPMSYFEYTPIGRILYSFARHQYTVDEVLSEALLQALVYIPLVVSVVVAVIIVVPYSAIVAFVLCMVIWLLNAVALQAERQLRRIEAESKPPIFAHLSATLEGLSSIRVYHSESRFDAANIEKIDTNTKALYAVTQVKGWLSLYVDLVAALFVYATALFILFFRDELEEGPAGLALTNAMQLAMFAQWALTAMREVHDSIGSVEELLRFGHSIPSEAAVTIKGHEPPADWPQHGEIEFEDVVLRYHRFGEPVVKRASFVINARERIGIVGRTGSGKSTLVISLLRLIEAAEGTIRIDGIDIASMGLRDLRSKIAVLPQEPTLFDGTVRSNLDPFEERTDEEIWGALRAAHLAEKIKSMPMRLEAPIIENGKGFSLGQRQLFCVARAILSKCRVLLMDEATSTLDIQTETVIQEAIRKNFANYTVLQIGHRLNTIIDADKIMVLDQGRIVEFDTPRHLLQNPDSFFSSMVLQSGEEAARKLREKVFAASVAGSEESQSPLQPTSSASKSPEPNAPSSSKLAPQTLAPPHSQRSNATSTIRFALTQTRSGGSVGVRTPDVSTPPSSGKTARSAVPDGLAESQAAAAMPASLGNVFSPPTAQEMSGQTTLVGERTTSPPPPPPPPSSHRSPRSDTDDSTV